MNLKIRKDAEPRPQTWLLKGMLMNKDQIDFKHRTMEVRGINYEIEIFLNGKLVASTSEISKEAADRYVNHMQKYLPNHVFKLTPIPYVEKVCIECGKESWE